MGIKQTKLVDFGKRSGLKVYPVGIGSMRLPEMEKAVPLVRQAIDAGMIYIDTSRVYDDSELKLAKALKDGYREKVILSTKWSPWVKKVEPSDDSSADCEYKRILESMKRLDVEYLDFYQIWNIDSPEHWEQATGKGGMLDGIVRAMDEGLVKHTGFTTHDTPENTSKYIDQADWCEAILFSYNLFAPTYQKAIAQAHEKGIATIVMNPMAGGMLAENSPVLKHATKRALDTEETIEAAHRYLNGDENVDVILCGITKPSDIISTVENYQKPPLDPKQRLAIEQELKKLSKESLGFCTDCKYCLPCPEGIRIPDMMQIIYLERMLKAPERAKEVLGWHLGKDNPERSAHPSQCTQCGKCLEKCTQKLNIPEELRYLLDSDIMNPMDE